MIIKKIIITFVLLGSMNFLFISPSSLVSPVFSLAQETPKVIEPPETMEEAKELGEKALETTQKELPGILEKIWEEDVLPIWQKMYDWFLTNIWPQIKSWFKKEVEPRVKEEVEKRKPIIEEEFEKEKEKLKEEIPEVSKSLWEKLNELIR